MSESSERTDSPGGRKQAPGAIEGLRLSLGTLTVLPVGVVRTDRRTAGAAMLWAPLVGAALGAGAGGSAWVCAKAEVPPLVAAVVGLVVLGGLTRGLHLDGLADTADGLGCGRDAEHALAVMKAPAVGAFGVVALILTLLLQAGALAGQLGAGHDGRVVVVAMLAGAAGRGVLPWACRSGVPAARSEGLGAMVASTVDPLLALGSLVLLLGAEVVVGGLGGPGFLRSAAAALLAAGAAEMLLRRCRTRFGGITGDVLGACIEVSATVMLVVLSSGPAFD